MPTMTTVTSYAPLATNSMTDLLLSIRDGDPAAWDEILRRYGKLVSTTVRSFRLQEADALDAVSPRRRALLRALFTDNPRSYAEVARTAGIPPGSIGPTRARALRQLRDKLDKVELGACRSGDTGLSHI